MSDRYYVYVYIDPRNFEEFYYGKGKGSRSQAHLQDTGDSVKVARIKAIQQEGLEPLIRIIARGLTSAEALMVETTLIWKLGRTLTNVASGQYVGKFRPRDTFHKRLARFDFENGLYYVNVGEGETRNWDDCLRFGFLAAGGKPKWSDPLRGLEEGDVVVAYLKGAGYVGVGLVRSPAVRYALYRHKGKALGEYDLVEPNIAHDADNNATCEYVVAVEWVQAVERAEAKWVPKSGLYTTTHIRASLDAQPTTTAFIEDAFGVDLGSLADGDVTLARQQHGGPTLRLTPAKAAPPIKPSTVEDSRWEPLGTAPRTHKAEIFADCVRTGRPHTPSDLRKQADSHVEAELDHVSP